MATKVLELNDAGLAVHGRDGVEFTSPGYALIRNGALEIGEAAWQHARLDPRRIQNRFWDTLDMDPLPLQAGGAHTQADLAYAHLAAVWERAGNEADSAFLAVPGSYTRKQLGLLLGIARECGLPVTGMIDAAVAASHQAANGASLIHLDLRLHRVVLTRLTRGERLSRTAVEDSACASLVTMREAWVAAIADSFVRTTRFDPLHLGETEQFAYQHLHEWLATAVASGSVNVDLQAGGKSHAVAVTRERLAQAVESSYAGIEDLIAGATRPGEPFTLLLSHRFADLPGFAERLDRLPDVERVVLQPGAVGQGALLYEEYIRSASGEAVGFVTQVPAGTGAGVRSGAGSAAPTRPQPTHVLYGSRAFAIGTEPLLLGTEATGGARALVLRGQIAGISRTHCAIERRGGAVIVEDRSTYGTFVNGARIEGSAALAVGDRLRLGSPGQELHLIETAD